MHQLAVDACRDRGASRIVAFIDIIRALMGISPGTRIGTYEITSPLGEGGMGVVYRARDTKLLRDVALKVLPDHFAGDPDRLSRFQREAQVLASLNHPNIAQIYGLESGCIVMELVEGETIAERLQRGPVSIEETIAIASQVADALEAAHERGIMHRDLKPANIKLTPAGQVKVLDFGLAKVLGAAEPGADPMNSPTLLSGSMPGMIMGTAAYMSPEQARGKSVDARTDVWAFGCVVYEMLTGRRLFEGEMVTDSIAKVIAGQPDWDALPPDTPPALRMMLAESLKKDPRQRLQHIHDARLFLNPALIPVAPRPATQPGPPRKRGTPWLTAALTLVLLAALYPATLYFTHTEPNQPVMRFEMPAPGILGTEGLVISPDGQRIVYVATSAGKQQVWVRPIGSLSAQPLAGTENAAGLFWAPDNRHVGFFADGKLKKVDVTGGGVQTLCDASIPAPGAWSRNGIILFTGVSGGPLSLMRVSEAGGQATPVIGAKQTEVQALPQFLPDDRHFIFHTFSIGGSQDASLDLGSLDSKETRRLMTLANVSATTNSPAIFASPGYILFSRDRTLLAQPFDMAHMSPSGEPSPIAENVRLEFSVSNNGILVYRTAADSQQPQQSAAQLSWFDRKGKQAGQIPSPAIVGSLRLSQDDQRIAIDNAGVAGATPDIWVIDSRGVPNKITADNPLLDGYPVWSPDASRVGFAAIREKDVTPQLYQKASNGVGAASRLLPENTTDVTLPTDWSLDGQNILFVRYAIGSFQKVDLWVLPTSGDGKPRKLLQNGFTNLQAQFSPDGRYIAYTTNEQGSFQIAVQTFPDPSLGKWTITREGGTEPIWRHDGRELYYLAPDGKIMAVSIKTGSNFDAGQPTPLFQTALRQQQPAPFARRYAVSSDGQRFLIASSSSQPSTSGNDTPITAVLNWTSILKKK